MGTNFAIPHLFFILILEFYVLYVTRTNVSLFLLPYFVILQISKNFYRNGEQH